MILLNSEKLNEASITHLNHIQQEINIEGVFEQKVKKAESKWSSKTSSTTAKATFTDIKTKLISMCSGAEICVYCEHNEATDIEHIFPKRLFPNKTFLWENYVLACGKCNTHFKKDRFSIFNPEGTVTVEDITPKMKIYLEPANADALFINQREEDPMSFLELDFEGKTFYFIERYFPGTREYEKAKYTKDILGLNKRDDLVQHRIAAFNYYKNELEKYVSVSGTQNKNELIKVVDGFIDTVDVNLDFEQEKNRILSSIKNRIKKHNHPTVWKEMQRQRDNLPETNSLFQYAPESIMW